eukprot:GABV01002940.1.p2 GENE.GABV01002940.1~~GABV01002940.1.p2  ORF type:complete len:104 (-),score=23.07 GABV01002940.1:33-344(-)
MVVSYLVEEIGLDVSMAVRAFSLARPSGIFRTDLLQALWHRYESDPDELASFEKLLAAHPPVPHLFSAHQHLLWPNLPTFVRLHPWKRLLTVVFSFHPLKNAN